jgi:hypothetical protein
MDLAWASQVRMATPSASICMEKSVMATGSFALDGRGA